MWVFREHLCNPKGAPIFSSRWLYRILQFQRIPVEKQRTTSVITGAIGINIELLSVSQKWYIVVGDYGNDERERTHPEQASSAS